MAAPGFQYFDSTQVGAPVLQGVAGSFIALLDWILVSKGGWDKAFSGTNLAAYRSQSGNRHYLRIDDTQVGYARARMYRAMTNVNTGTNQYPTNAQAGNINLWGVVKKYSGSTARPQRYWGIRTNRYVILFIGRIGDVPETSYEYRTPFIFGDIPSLAEGDAHNSFIIASSNADAVYYNSSSELFPAALTTETSVSDTAVTAAVSGNPSGSLLSPLVCPCLPYGNAATTATGSVYGSGNRLSYQNAVLLCKTAATAVLGNYPRAAVPNLHQVWGLISNFDNSTYPCTDLTTFTIGSRTFLPIADVNQNPLLTGPDQPYRGMLLEVTDTDPLGAL